MLENCGKEYANRKGHIIPQEITSEIVKVYIRKPTHIRKKNALYLFLINIY